MSVSTSNDPQARVYGGRLVGVANSARDARLVIGTLLGFFDVAFGSVQGSGRYKQIALPRHLCMYLLRIYTRMSFPQIGKTLGGRDHSTVVSACYKAMALRHDSEQGRTLASLRSLLEGAGLSPDLGRLPSPRKRPGAPIYE
ncbi:MAG: hypothetical protein HYY51_01415 [Candidatus Magasanikbacteria bacterium]|nr:hypothetical protein [Candidatus Magasanikbacteria bacterium]